MTENNPTTARTSAMAESLSLGRQGPHLWLQPSRDRILQEATEATEEMTSDSVFSVTSCEKVRVLRSPTEKPCSPRGFFGHCDMDCRSGCGACCIAPSISSPIPGMPHGKPAGVKCVQLLPDYRCALFGQPERPAVCVSLRPTQEMCGANREEALTLLATLEFATAPDRLL